MWITRKKYEDLEVRCEVFRTQGVNLGNQLTEALKKRSEFKLPFVDKEAAEYLSCTVFALRKRVERGQLGVHGPKGSPYRFTKKDLDRYMKSGRRKATR